MLQVYTPHTPQTHQTSLVHNLTQKAKRDHGKTLFTMGTPSIFVSHMSSEAIKSQDKMKNLESSLEQSQCQINR